MTQPPPLPQPTPLPPAPTRPQIGQAIGGAVLTIAGTIGISCASTVFPGSVTDNVFAVIGFICVVSLTAGLVTAQRLRRQPSSRGWAMGIYIGLAITVAFFAVVTFFLLILVIKGP